MCDCGLLGLCFALEVSGWKAIICGTLCAVALRLFTFRVAEVLK